MWEGEDERMEEGERGLRGRGMRQQEEEEEHSQAVREGKSWGGRKSKPGQGEAKVAV